MSKKSKGEAKKRGLSLEVQKAFVDFAWLDMKVQSLGEYLEAVEYDYSSDVDYELLHNYYLALSIARNTQYLRINDEMSKVVGDEDDVFDYISDEAFSGEDFDVPVEYMEDAIDDADDPSLDGYTLISTENN